MKLALELPTVLLKDFNGLGDFDFPLAPRVLEIEEYRSFYRNSGRFKILDTGVNEGSRLSASELVRAGEMVEADVVMCSDRQGDADATIQKFHDFLPYLPALRLMGVIQGMTLEDILRCAMTYWEHGIDFIGVSYTVLTEPGTYRLGTSPALMSERRERAVDYLLSNAPFTTKIHLLGFNNFEELTGYKGVAEVVSLDTGHPVLYGLLGKKYGLDQINRPQEFLDINASDISTRQKELIKHNINYLKGILNYGLSKGEL